MPIYDLTKDSIAPLPATTFAQLGIGERTDLQRLLRDNIDVIAPDTLVISEEFGNWEDSRRRIDLLAIDKEANIVVIELKRTEDGGHMELQGVRYAAMVSTMTFQQTVQIYSHYLAKRGLEIDAQSNLLKFLGWDEPDEEQFANDARIVLASAEFSKELTTAVLWLCDRGIDIRCVRLKPYGTKQRIQLDVQQVIPLPEAEDYQIKVREKKQAERETRRSNKDFTKYTVISNGERFEKLAKRNAMRQLVKALVDEGHSPEDFKSCLSWRTYFILSYDGKNADEVYQAMYKDNHDMSRWFNSEDDIIYFNEKAYVLSNQWGPRTEEAMRSLIEHCKPENITFERYEA
jgi:hypothetical protein